MDDFRAHGFQRMITDRIQEHVAAAPFGLSGRDIVAAIQAERPQTTSDTTRGLISKLCRKNRLKRDKTNRTYVICPLLDEPTFCFDGYTAAILHGKLWHRTETVSAWAGFQNNYAIPQIVRHFREALDRLEPQPGPERLLSTRQIEALVFHKDLPAILAPLRRFEAAWQAHCARNLPAIPEPAKAPDMTQPDTDQTGTAVAETPFEHNGMSVLDINGELYIRDIDVGKRLGLAQPSSLRRTLEDNLAEYQDFGSFRVVPEMIALGKGAKRAVDVYYLNQTHVAIATVTARTEVARAARKEIISVYMAWREGRVHERPSQAAAAAPRQEVSAPLHKTLETALVQLKAAEERLAENRANMAADMDAIDAIKAELLKKLAA